MTNDKSGFRGCKVRTKDALVQIFRGREFFKSMEWIESPSKKLTGRAEMDEVAQQAEEESGIPQHEETYRKIGEAMGLLRLSENRSESFLMTKRAGDGWTTWSRVNKWYMAPSGLAWSDRKAAIIKPPQSEKDEDVVYDFEEWSDDIRECRALGASELEYDYRPTALRMIATDPIREKMDYEDAKVQTHRTKRKAPRVNWKHL